MHSEYTVVEADSIEKLISSVQYKIDHEDMQAIGGISSYQNIEGITFIQAMVDKDDLSDLIS